MSKEKAVMTFLTLVALCGAAKAQQKSEVDTVKQNATEVSDTVEGRIEKVRTDLRVKATAGYNDVAGLMISEQGVGFFNNTYLNGSFSSTVGKDGSISFNATELVNAKNNPGQGNVSSVNVNGISVAAFAMLKEEFGNGNLCVKVGREPTNLYQFTSISTGNYVSENLGANFINITDGISVSYNTNDGKSVQVGWMADCGDKDKHAWAVVVNPLLADGFAKVVLNNMQLDKTNVSTSLGARFDKDGIKKIFASLAMEYESNQISVGGHVDKDKGLDGWATYVRDLDNNMKLLVTYTQVQKDNTVTITLEKDKRFQVYGGVKWNSNASETPEAQTTTTATGPTVFAGVSFTGGGGWHSGK